MITVTINGKVIRLEKPVTILEAARQAGIKIPTLCHHETLEPFGGCRLCLVEIENVPRLQTSCTQYVADGMAVWTETERVVEARKAILEFLLINHALDCPYCDKAGECELQDVVVKYGPASGRFAEGRRRHPESCDDPIIVRNMERCISCSRCVRMCDQVQGASAISMVNRSSKTFVEPFSGERYNCEYCGNCITVCPVGAIMSRLHKHAYRPWLIEKEADTVCSFCGVGCSLAAQVRGNSIVRTVPRHDKGLNKGILCVRGRFGYDYVGSHDRLVSPLIRRNGVLQQATWSEAFTYIAGSLKKIKEKNGSNALAGIASGRCTNEDSYVFQKFIRTVLGSNNIDSSAGLAYGPAQRFFERIFGQGVTANPLHGIHNSDGIFVIGGDPTAINPVLGIRIRSASREGVLVVTVGYTPGLKRFASNCLTPHAYTETALLSLLVTELLKKKTLSGENPSFEEVIKKIDPVALSESREWCGIPSDVLSSAVDALAGMTNPSFVIGRDIIQRTEGHANLLLLSALVYLLNGRIYLLSEHPNEQGLVDMGCQPDMLPGGRPLNIDSFRKRYEAVLETEIASVPGLSFTEIIDGAASGAIKGLYVMGENVAFNMPDNAYVKQSLSNLELLVVQDIFLTETAHAAHVVLPSLSWTEKEGSYTNLEGRMQYLPKATDGSGMEDWRIIAEISKLLGFDMKFRDAEDVLSEIAKVSPLHKDITFGDMINTGCMWPYKGEPLRHDIGIEGIACDIRSLLKKPVRDKIYAGINKPLFHSESLSRHSSALHSISAGPCVAVGKRTADAMPISDNDYVGISTDAGSLELPVKIDPDLPENIVLLANDSGDKGVMKIMKWSVNPVLKCPAMNSTEVLIKKIEKAAEEVAV